MKEKMKTVVCVLILVFSLPYIITMVFQRDTDVQSRSFSVSEEELDYLIGAVAAEMPVSYEPEALRAQAVIARTNHAFFREQQQELPESLTVEEMRQMWGESSFEANYEKIKQAVLSTTGERMMMDHTVIHGAYHAVSAGITKSGKKAMPYLAAVESKQDLTSTDYLQVIYLEKEELRQKLGTEADTDQILKAIREAVRDEAGYVEQIQLGEATLTGEQIREALKLSSSCFYCKEVEGKIRIVTKGLGHGLGLSQYGANELAKEGWDYRQILEYYYKNIEISD